ncbi:hypothetical protein NDU88_000715, partial [Pleurodeles waltl]
KCQSKGLRGPETQNTAHTVTDAQLRTGGEKALAQSCQLWCDSWGASGSQPFNPHVYGEKA